MASVAAVDEFGNRSYRLPPDPLPEPASGAQMADTAQRALQFCGGPDAADGAAMHSNEALRRALDPLRLLPALEVRCGRCGHGIAYAALDPTLAYVVSGNRRQPPKKRRGGVFDWAGIEPGGPGHGFPEWVEDAKAGKGTVRPTGERPGIASGFPERRTHSCTRCKASYTHTNTRLLQMFLYALNSSDTEIRLK